MSRVVPLVVLRILTVVHNYATSKTFVAIQKAHGKDPQAYGSPFTARYRKCSQKGLPSPLTRLVMPLYRSRARGIHPPWVSFTFSESHLFVLGPSESLRDRRVRTRLRALVASGKTPCASELLARGNLHYQEMIGTTSEKTMQSSRYHLSLARNFSPNPPFFSINSRTSLRIDDTAVKMASDKCHGTIREKRSPRVAVRTR